MKFRLDTQHYLHDRLLEPGTIIGEDTGIPMVLPNGEKMHPSVNMTPLDDEAWAYFKEIYPEAHMPERDPTKAIPLRGTGDAAKSPPLIPPQPQDPAIAINQEAARKALEESQAKAKAVEAASAPKPAPAPAKSEEKK